MKNVWVLQVTLLVKKDKIMADEISEKKEVFNDILSPDLKILIFLPLSIQSV